MSSTLIFVPTYNERHNVERMVRDLSALPIDADLMFVDDNSPDGTGTILDRLAETNPRLTVLHRQGKLGIGSAHLVGIEWAYDRGYEFLITLDCDFTHDPGDVIRLFENVPGYDVTVGSRYLAPDSLPGWNPLRRTLTGFGHLLTKYLLRIPFDATGALRCYHLPDIPRSLFRRVTSMGYGFFFESMFVLVRAGHSVREFPIVLPARTYGSSKMTFKETMRSGTQLLSLWGRSIAGSARQRTEANSAAPADNSNGWDLYWSAKSEPTGRVYDVIATTYRQQVITKGLERVVRRSFPSGAHLLHAGCGSGQVDQGMQSDFRITAVDLSPSAIRLYRANNAASSDAFQADIFSLPFPTSTFDGVYNLGVMEHFTLDEIRAILSEFNRVLKPDGKLVMFWPHERATSVAVLGSAHWVLNRVLKKSIQLHPPEISLMKSREWIRGVLADCGLHLSSYSFGPRDLFVQAEIVAQKTATAPNA